MVSLVGQTISHYPALWDFPLPGSRRSGGIRNGVRHERDPQNGTRKRNTILEHLIHFIKETPMKRFSLLVPHLRPACWMQAARAVRYCRREGKD